jgi:hypothetical protein
MLWIFSAEKSDGFGRVRTRDPEASMLTARSPKQLESFPYINTPFLEIVRTNDEWFLPAVD